MSQSSGSGAGRFTEFRLDSQTDQAVALMVMLLDRQDGALPVRRLRDWAIERSAPRPGETVVDVGSGTGTVVRELAALVGPGGRAVGVEPNPRLRALATERAGGAGSAAAVQAAVGEGPDGTRPEFVDGLADRLPFDDGGVDLIWCERVLQHLADPQAALTEFFRVLRPGGRVALLDSDHGSRVVSDVDPDVAQRINQAFLDSTPNPFAARNVPRQAQTAGFTVDPDINSAALMTLPPDPHAPGIIEMAVRNAIAAGRISPDEGDEALAVHGAARAAGTAFVTVTIFGFLLIKPA